MISKTSLLALADPLAEDVDSCSSVISAARQSSTMPAGSTAVGGIDMSTFVGYIMDSLKKNDPAAVACASVLSAYDLCMIGMRITKNSDLFGCKGMGVMFPPSYSMCVTSSHTA